MQLSWKRIASAVTKPIASKPLSAALDKAQLAQLLVTAEDASGRAHLQLLQRPAAGAWLLARPALSEEEWYGTYHQTLNKIHLTARLPRYGQSTLPY
jgi:hypothetical protein